MLFKGWQKTSLIEYPGRVATVLFTGGCSFRCPYCYNASLVLEDPSLPGLDGEEVLAFLGARRGLYQAAVLTGGEPTLAAELPEFCRRVGELGLLRGLETNGSRPGVLRGLLNDGLVDYVALDVKAPLNWESYRRAAGLTEGQRGLLEAVRESISLLQASSIDVEFRTTAVPGLHSQLDLLEVARGLAGPKRFALQGFRPAGALEPALRRAAPFPRAALESVAGQAAAWFSGVQVRF